MRGTGFRHKAFESLEQRVLFSTFTVTNTDDTGPGSLRQAMTDANATTTADVIHFDIAAASKVIKPHSPLPAIIHDVVIDGTSQSGYKNKPLIEINGPLAGANARGIDIKTGAATIKGLAITSFKSAGIVIASAGGCVIQGCNIGVDATGTKNRGNGQNAIVIAGSSNNTIGGTADGQGNILAYNGTSSHSLTGGNTVPAILVYGAGTKNRFLHNSIYDNHGFGIDLVAGKDSKGRLLTTPDPVPNTGDQTDADTGPNGLQNAAGIYFAGPTPGYLSVLGNLQTAPKTHYHLELFSSNNAFRNTGPVQARTYITSTDVLTDKTGFAQIFMQISETVPGALFTVTTTGPDGTSEISLPTLSRAGTVSGNVFVDKNLNGVKDTGETGVGPGLFVYFDQNLNGKRDIGEPRTTTDAAGNYTFADAQGGPERVRVDLLAEDRVTSLGYRVLAPSTGYWDMTLPTAKSTKNRNFALTTTGVISGVVFNDANKSGKRDKGEAGLSGWTVFIDSNGNGVLDGKEKSRTTDKNGNYQFANIAAGTYVIHIVGQTGFKVISPASVSAKLASGGTRSANFGVHTA